MGCIEPDTVLDYLRGDLSPEARAGVEDHVDACSECRVLLGELGGMCPASEPGVASLDGMPCGPGIARGPMTTGQRIGRYVALDWLGAGGMGVVYSAYDPELDRKVAVKLWRPDQAIGAVRDRNERLLREARILAQVSHPNVIGVLDVGTDGDAVFLAMEFVGGETLRQWQSTSARPWRAIVSKYVEAGRGLAAAHAAGVTHRDFKPENVLVGPAERVRVTDFGLARTDSAADFSDERLAPSSAGGSQGSMAGTPAYMAPEQRGGRATARSDQYAFCVALYEALYGAHPAALAETVGERLAAPAPPEDGRVPGWIRAALLRGLHPQPASRYPSMRELLAALERDPARRARRIAASVGAGFALLALGTLVPQIGAHRDRGMCRGAEQRLSGIWDESGKRAVHDAFVATGVPYAEATWKTTTQALDDYARQWTSMRTEVCEATRVRGEQSEALLDGRMACLDERLLDLKSLAELLSHADGSVVETSVRAAYALRPIRACADAKALNERSPLPADAATRPIIDRLRGDLATVKTLHDAGKYADGLERAKRATLEARATGYWPVIGEAFLWQGKLEKALADKTAENDLTEAVAAAERGHDDATRSEALIQLVLVLGYLEAKNSEAERIGALASAALERLGGNGKLRADLEHALGTNELSRGAYARAAEHFDRALALLTEVYGSDHFLVGLELLNTGLPREAEGKYDVSVLDNERRALAILQSTVGSRHPEVAHAYSNMSSTLYGMDRYSESLDAAQEALAIYKAVLPAGHPQLGSALTGMGMNLVALAKHDEAREYLTLALGIFERAYGPHHPQVGRACARLSLARYRAADYPESVAFGERARAIHDENHVADGLEHADVLASLGEAYSALHRPRSAWPLFERALAIDTEQGGAPRDVARARFDLARAIGGMRGKDARARLLAGGARDFYAAEPGTYAKELGEIDAWLGG